MSTGTLENVINKMCLEIIYLTYVQNDLGLNNLQWLIGHKTKPNQISYNYVQKT